MPACRSTSARALTTIATIAADNTNVTSPRTSARMRLRRLRKMLQGTPMSHGNSIGRQAIATCITLVAIAGSFSCAAADISVIVVDHDGRGVADVVVAVSPVVAMPAGAHPAVGL